MEIHSLNAEDLIWKVYLYFKSEIYYGKELIYKIAKLKQQLEPGT